MTDEIGLNKATSRAAQAEALLRNELLQEAFQKIDAELVTLWKTTKDSEERDRIWQAAQIAERVQALLKSVVQNGKLAQAELNAIAGRKKSRQ